MDYTAPAFNGVAKDDWWLPSIGELMVMYTNLRTAGAGSFVASYYFSSSEYNATQMYLQDFRDGIQTPGGKSGAYRVRPVRGF